MEDFDFHCLARKELQALCKRNKIPANLTNVAMADSLQALDQVEGLDEVLQASKSDPQRSCGKTMPGTPAVPPSGRRSTVRTKPIVEPETSKPLTRARRTTRKAAASEASCPPVTPATGVNRRKVAVDEASKFSLEGEGDEVADPETVKASASVVANGCKKGSSFATSSHKGERSVQNVYSTRRSVRFLEDSMMKMNLTEKKMMEDAEQNGGVAGDFEEKKDNEVQKLEDEFDKIVDHEANEPELKNGSPEEKDESKVGISIPDASVGYSSEEETGMNHDLQLNCNKTIGFEVADSNGELEAGSYEMANLTEEKMVEDAEQNGGVAGDFEEKNDNQVQKIEVEFDKIVDHEANELELKNESPEEKVPDESKVEITIPDASVGYSSLEEETGMNHELQLNGNKTTGCEVADSKGELEAASYELEENEKGSPHPSDSSVESFGEWSPMEEEAIDESGLISRPRPALRSIIVLNSHLDSSVLQLPEDSSAVVTEIEPTMENEKGSLHPSDSSVESFGEWSPMEEEEAIDESGLVSRPRPALRSIIVLNSHLDSSILQLPEDSSAVPEDSSAVVTEIESTVCDVEVVEDHSYSLEGSEEDHSLIPTVTVEEESDGKKSDGVEVNNVLEVTNTEEAAATAPLAYNGIEVSTFAAEGIQGQFPRPTIVPSSSAKKQTKTLNLADIASEANKENTGNWTMKADEEAGKDEIKMKKGSKALDDLSMRQLTKMLKEKLEKLQLADNNKKAEGKATEKVEGKRQAMKTLCGNYIPTAEAERNNH